jgi:NitT/TauT family transport system substrate-binding protein
MNAQPTSYWLSNLTRRRFLRAAGLTLAGAGAGVLFGCGGDDDKQATASTPTPLPPPETANIRLSFAACDGPCMVSEHFLQEEGFQEVQLLAGASAASLTSDRADIAMQFVTSLAGHIEAGVQVVAIGALHPGCTEIWAPRTVATLKDMRGRTVVVRTKAIDEMNFQYPYLAIALKHAGLDPADVNFIVQPEADLTRQFIEGNSDLLQLATTGAIAFRANPQNQGHLVHDQAMEKPWSEHQCCLITTTKAWLQAHPVAAKRALRALYRAADSLPKDRAEAAKAATDKGLFGGPASAELVRGAMSMLEFEWRKYDVADSLRFHGKLLNDVGLVKMPSDEVVAKGTELRYTKELAAELKRPS